MSRAGILVQLTGPPLEPAGPLAAMAHRGPPRGEVTGRGWRGWVVSHDQAGDGWDVHEATEDDGWTVVVHGRLLPPGPTSAAELADLLAADGPAGLRRALGPFAIVARRDRDAVTLLARDCSGERPLFVTESDAGTLVASEPVALLAAGRTLPVIDEVSAATVLAGHKDLGSATLWKGVRRVPAGEAVLRGPGSEQVISLWPEEPVAPFEGDADALAARYEHLLRTIVTDSLPAIGPVVCDVSGGLDSSAVAVVLRDALPDADARLVTITLALDEDPIADEREYAEAVLAGTPGRHVVLRPSPPSVDDQLDEARTTAEPPGAPNTVPAPALRARAAEGATRWYCGSGGDELFEVGSAPLVDLLRARRWRAAVAMARAFAGEEGGSATTRATARTLWSGGVRPRLRPVVRRLGIGRRAKVPDHLDASWVARIGWRPADPECQAAVEAQGASAYVLEGLRSPYSTLTNEGGERFAALARLETVNPFQDRRFMELALSLPPELRLRDGDARWVQRTLPGLPPEVAARRTKAVFSVLVEEAVAAYLEDPEALEALAATGWTPDRTAGALRERLGAARPQRAWAMVAVDAWLRALPGGT